MPSYPTLFQSFSCFSRSARRCLHSTSRVAAATTEETTSATAGGATAAPPTPREIGRKKADNWLRGEGRRFKLADGAGGFNFVTQSRKPFPMNPLFEPVTPLSNDIRTKIYAQYKSNPKVETPLKLAQEYKISIVRVQAVLRLKALEQNMKAEGKSCQENLTLGMEKLLCVHTSQRIPEAIHATPTERMKPLYQFVDDESEGISPEDAAKLLDLEPFANVQHRLDKNAARMFNVSEPTPEKSPKDVIEKDPLLAGKVGFVFTDISKPANRDIFVRDADGTFRKASRLERFKKTHANPKFFL